MSGKIKLKTLNLIASNAALHAKEAIHLGGALRIEVAGIYAEPVTVDDHAEIEANLKVDIGGNLLNGAPAKGKGNVFDFSVEFSGVFEVSSEDAKQFDEVAAFRAVVSENMANRIYPLIRGYITETLTLMGVENIELPWQLDLGGEPDPAN